MEFTGDRGAVENSVPHKLAIKLLQESGISFAVGSRLVLFKNLLNVGSNTAQVWD